LKAEYHIPVLLRETIEALNIKTGGLYLDGTAGGGGHAFAIASQLTTGRLIALDQDPDAIEECAKRLEGLPVTVIRKNFIDIDQVLEKDQADGVLLDIGVSSHQLDTPERGFSFHHDAPLDMRMNCRGPSAMELVAGLGEKELADILFRYGEEKFARRIADAIVRERQQRPITTTGQLADIIREAVPAVARRDGHPARKSFQALRITVNRELDALDQGLNAAFRCLKPGGRLCVITFHSLEDKIVKERFREWKQGCTCPTDFPVCVCGNRPKAKILKPMEALPQEVTANPRSRSAKLRTAIKL